MTKDVGILILGLAVSALPFIGIPNSWKTAVFVILGLAIAILAFLLRGDLPLRRKGEHSDGERKTETFSENGTAYARKKVLDGILRQSSDEPHEKERKTES